MDAPFGDALAPDLDAHLVGPDQARGERRFGRCRDDGQLQRRPGPEAIMRPRREQQRRRLAAEDVLALAHGAKPIDVRDAAEPDERGLFVAGVAGELFVRLAPDRSEREVGPARRGGADALRGVANEVLVAHRPRARR